MNVLHERPHFWPKQRYSLVNRQKLTDLLGIKDNDLLSEYHLNWVEEVLKNGSNQRDAKWTESIAVGDKEFVMETKAKLGAKAIGRRELENNEGYGLNESQSPYNRVFDPEKCSLRLKKYYHKMWLGLMISIGYTISMFNTYSISKYFFCFLDFTNVPLKS